MKGSSEDYRRYKEGQGANVSSPRHQAPSAKPTREFSTTVLNAIVSCKTVELAQHRNPQQFIDSRVELGYIHSLVFSEAAHVCRQHENLLPWTVSATSANSDGSRTWFIAFNPLDTFSSAYEDLTLHPIKSKNVPTGSVHMLGKQSWEKLETGFDPTFAIPWLEESCNHRVVFCGYALGGAFAMLEFLRLLRIDSIDWEYLIKVGRLKCITFGTPLIGDQKFATEIKNLSDEATKYNRGVDDISHQPFVNFIHQNDFFPRLLATVANTALNCSDMPFDPRPIFTAMDSSISVTPLTPSSSSSGDAPLSPFLASLAASEPSQAGATRLIELLEKRLPSEPLRRPRTFYTASGSVVYVAEGDKAIWCDRAQVGELFSPLLKPFPPQMHELIVARSFDTHYAQPLQQIFRTGMPLCIPEPQLLAPRIRPQLCSVTKAKSTNTFTVMIGGEFLHFLESAQIRDMMEEDEFSPVVWKYTNGRGAELAIYCIEGRKKIVEDDPDSTWKGSDAEFEVEFQGVFGGPVLWSSGRYLNEIGDVDDGMLEDELLVKKDGRFILLGPGTMIDVALLRMSFLLRAIASDSTRGKLGDRIRVGQELHILDVLSQDHTERHLIEWLRGTQEIMLDLLHSAHTDVILSTPQVLHQVVSGTTVGGAIGKAGGSELAAFKAGRVRRDRVGHIVESLVHTGLRHPRDDRKHPSSSKTDEEQRQLTLHRYRLLHVASAAGMDTETLLPLVEKSASYVRLDDSRRAIENFIHDHPVIQTTYQATYDPSKIVAKMVQESIYKGGLGVSPSVIGIRALARTPFQDTSLIVSTQYGQWSNSPDQVEKPSLLVRASSAFLPSSVASIFGLKRREESKFTIEAQTLFDSLSKLAGNKYLSADHKLVDLQNSLLDDLIISHQTEKDKAGGKGGGVSRPNQAMAADNDTINYKRMLEIVVQATRNPSSDSRMPPYTVNGDMFSLECQLRQRMNGLQILGRVLNYDPQNDETEAGYLSKEDVLADGADTPTFPTFAKMLRASLQIHNLRLHVGSTYVVCIVGTRGAGKGTFARNVLGVNAECGAADEGSSKDVQSYYIPVAGRSAIKHLLVLDFPGSDEVIANSSLLTAEGYSVADLVIMVSKQERLATDSAVGVFGSLVASIGGIEEAVKGKRNVWSWVDSDEWDDTEESDAYVKDTRKSVCKLAFLMSMADEHLMHMAADEDEGNGGAAVDLDIMTITEEDTDSMREQSIQGFRARENADTAWSSFSSCFPNSNDLDKVAVANVCTRPDYSERVSGKNAGITSRALRAGAILDPYHLVDFLARIVPPEVGNALKERRGCEPVQYEDIHGKTSAVPESDPHIGSVGLGAEEGNVTEQSELEDETTGVPTISAIAAATTATTTALPTIGLKEGGGDEITPRSPGSRSTRRPSESATKLRYVQMEANGMVPLPLLDVDQVCTLLEAMELNQYVEAFRKARITGEQLQEFESAEDFEEEGIIMTKVKSKVFLKRIAEYREFGVEAEIFEVDESGMVDEDTYDIDGNGPLSPTSNGSEGEAAAAGVARIINEDDFFDD